MVQWVVGAEEEEDRRKACSSRPSMAVTRRTNSLRAVCRESNFSPWSVVVSPKALTESSRHVFNLSIEKLTDLGRSNLYECIFKLKKLLLLKKSEDFWIRIKMLYSYFGMVDQAVHRFHEMGEAGFQSFFLLFSVTQLTFSSTKKNIHINTTNQKSIIQPFTNLFFPFSIDRANR
ncbi:hypothetical protein NE237_018610 [Protea cynaroides]|uniref:Pentatricopeptide repeat-containing protein n=1 Tax=Protea cynaroides TaxID=273540 RepID=A0A9Q0KA70_9MAGN|nr:hypothetical protein NE237_018610 [Protea cynaroides]